MARKRNQYGKPVLRGKTWSFRWREYFPKESGKKPVNHRQPLGTIDEIPTFRAAQRERDRFLRTINQTGFAPSKVCTFEEFATYWIDTVLTKTNKKPSHTYNSSTIIQNRLIPYFGDAKLHLITRRDVQEFIASLYGLSPSTIRNQLKPLKKIFAHAENLGGYIAENPTTNIELPEMEESEGRVISYLEVQSILRASQEPEYTMFWLLVETGMRAGELFGFPVFNLLLDRSVEIENEDGIEVIHSPAVKISQSVWNGNIVKTKTKKARTVEISYGLADQLSKFISTHWKANEMNLLFSSRKGTPIHYSNFLRRKFHPLLKELHIERAGLHAFRHYSETRMDSLSVPMKVRQERLGHSDLSMVERYSHVVSRDSRRTAERLNPTVPNRKSHKEDAQPQTTMIQ